MRKDKMKALRTGDAGLEDAGNARPEDAGNARPEALEPETFEPETFEPETFEPETFEPETFEWVLSSRGLVWGLMDLTAGWETPHDDSPDGLLGRLHVAAMMAEVGFFPFCVARDAAERDLLGARIGEVLALDRAAAAGVIGGFVICWEPMPYPRRPASVRLHRRPGGPSREQVLGDYGRAIRRLVDDHKRMVTADG